MAATVIFILIKQDFQKEMAMNRISILRGWRGWLCGLAALSLSACMDEELSGSASALKEGEISLQWVAANMGRVVTKGTDRRTSAEKEIKDVHIFLFGPDGNYLESGNNAFQGYRHLESGRNNWILQTELFANTNREAENATIYVLANMPEETFTVGPDGKPEELKDTGKTPMEALEAMTITLPDFTTEIPETGLPMVLKEEDHNLMDESERVITLRLESMMARIDLDFTMDPLVSNGSVPSLEFTKVSVGHFPKGGKVASQLETEEETNVESYGLIGEEEVPGAALVGKVLREGSQQGMTLYMFEHGRLPKQDMTYPDSLDVDTEAQRYKNTLAKEDAAYVKLEGLYTTQSGLVYGITYTLYVGANPNDDFTIKPNCQYKNNITVTGITVNNRETGIEALLDTRVDVDDNAVFIEMLRERMFDAHFNVTPMDIYIFDPEVAESVTVTILNERGEPAGENEMMWIRMEPYRYAPKEKCDYKEEQYAATRAGDGKRKYFTVGLMDELDKYSYSRSYTVTQPEERIYFYVDENVPTKDQYEAHEPVEERSVTVKITYHAQNGSTTDRYATFTQAGMKIVKFDKFGSPDQQGWWGPADDAYYFYLEEYEEYLSHYDGKNEYTETYEGLEWGLDGVHTGLGAPSDNDWGEYMKWGWYNTDEIMDKFRESSLWRGHEMTLNERPIGAAEYCYNKNKRTDDGEHSPEYVEWFLPTISEIEYAMDRYYTDYDDFRGKYYWSSNPGAIGNNGVGNEGENPENARATKTTTVNGVFVHAQSAVNQTYPTYWENGIEYDGGSAKRAEKFRIRAIYVPRFRQDDIKIRH